MEITVVVTAFNDQEFVMDTLESVLTQTRLPARLGVVMGPSRDDTREFVGFYQDELDFFEAVDSIDPVRQGSARLRLRGLDLARGEYVFFLPAGAYLYRDAVERMGQLTRGEAELLGGGVQVVTSSGRELQWGPPGGLSWPELRPLGPLHPGSLLWNRELLASMQERLGELRLGPFTTLGWLILAARRHVRARWMDEPVLEDWSGIEGAFCWTRGVYDGMEKLIELGGPEGEDLTADLCRWVQESMEDHGGRPSRNFIERQGYESGQAHGTNSFWIENRIDFPE